MSDVKFDFPDKTPNSCGNKERCMRYSFTMNQLSSYVQRRVCPHVIRITSTNQFVTRTRGLVNPIYGEERLCRVPTCSWHSSASWANAASLSWWCVLSKYTIPVAYRPKGGSSAFCCSLHKKTTLNNGRYVSEYKI
jgi:hypothetical protein